MKDCSNVNFGTGAAGRAKYAATTATSDCGECDGTGESARGGKRDCDAPAGEYGIGAGVCCSYNTGGNRYSPC